jgi:hypothetical protein
MKESSINSFILFFFLFCHEMGVNKSPVEDGNELLSEALIIHASTSIQVPQYLSLCRFSIKCLVSGTTETNFRGEKCFHMRTSICETSKCQRKTFELLGGTSFASELAVLRSLIKLETYALAR